MCIADRLGDPWLVICLLETGQVVLKAGQFVQGGCVVEVSRVLVLI